MKKSPYILIVLMCFLALVGCSGEPTNAPSDIQIADANAARAKAIDDDPSMSAEDKAKMKRALKLDEPRTKEQGR